MRGFAGNLSGLTLERPAGGGPLRVWSEADGRGSVGARLVSAGGGWSGHSGEGIAGQTIPVHDGRAAEPMSALRYVNRHPCRGGFGGVHSVCRYRHDAPIPLRKPWRNLGEPVASGWRRWQKAGTSNYVGPFWSQRPGNGWTPGYPGARGACSSPTSWSIVAVAARAMN